MFETCSEKNVIVFQSSINYFGKSYILWLKSFRKLCLVRVLFRMVVFENILQDAVKRVMRGQYSVNMLYLPSSFFYC